MDNDITCPFCGYIHASPDDCDEGENPYECGGCGRDFRVIKKTRVTYRVAPNPKVVPWQNSRIGDLTEFDGKLAKIYKGINGECAHNCMFIYGDCPRHFDIRERLLCDCHPSGGRVNFVEVE